MKNYCYFFLFYYNESIECGILNEACQFVQEKQEDRTWLN